MGIGKAGTGGLKKNENRLYAMFACANLYILAIARRRLRETDMGHLLPFSPKGLPKRTLNGEILPETG